MAWAYDTTTDCSATFMTVKTVSLTVTEVDDADEKFIWNAFHAAGLHPTMILVKHYGQALPDAEFTFTYVAEQELKSVKKVYFKLLLKYPDMKYTY